MPKPKPNRARERRITDQIVVGAHNEEERAMGWHCYLEEQLGLPSGEDAAGHQARRFRHFARTRHEGGIPAPPPGLFHLTLTLERPVAGPLCLGWSCHLGLGSFVPTPPMTPEFHERLKVRCAERNTAIQDLVVELLERELRAEASRGPRDRQGGRG